MATGLDTLKQTITGEINKAVMEINDNTTKTAMELSVQIGLLKIQLEELRAMVSTKPKVKKADEAPADPSAPVDPAAPAAKPKGKKDNAASWFKAKYAEDAALRDRVAANPDIAKMLAEMDAELKRKKTESSRHTAIATAILKHHAPVVQAEFAANNSTPLTVPAE
jgi:hypothetical protein